MDKNINRLQEKTGKTMDEWIAQLRDSHKYASHIEIVRHLKKDFGLNHLTANLIAGKSLQAGPSVFEARLKKILSKDSK